MDKHANMLIHRGKQWFSRSSVARFSQEEGGRKRKKKKTGAVFIEELSLFLIMCWLEWREWNMYSNEKKTSSRGKSERILTYQIWDRDRKSTQLKNWKHLEEANCILWQDARRQREDRKVKVSQMLRMGWDGMGWFVYRCCSSPAGTNLTLSCQISILLLLITARCQDFQKR